MSVPESIAWLETSRDSKSPSMAQVYATTILGELERMGTALHLAAEERERLEQLRHDAVSAHRALESTVQDLEASTRRAREEWDEELAAAIPVVDELCAWVDTNLSGCVEVQQRGEELLQRLRKRAGQ